ncbi:hypothetical protein E2C01_053607 [Portunus trituberculatus]|uniref:Uncharacterized protein n=1 Tax=Portunus trituberculatus TaxID=210409 RepID=A0A5B7GPT8_PORTR|nr:hypothetical protein [Portunus trituberculatus]
MHNNGAPIGSVRCFTHESRRGWLHVFPATMKQNSSLMLHHECIMLRRECPCNEFDGNHKAKAQLNTSRCPPGNPRQPASCHTTAAPSPSSTPFYLAGI